jgi:hypothetical protein
MPKFINWFCGILVVLISSCSNTSKAFNVGECLMPQAAQNQEKIVLVVSVSEKEYKFFTHFLTNGRLVQAQDYQTMKKTEIENTYVKVVCPEFESSFSPDRYLNEKKQ